MFVLHPGLADMTISFIPLRMAELTTTSILPRDVLLGLPISAEMGMTGLSVLIAGTWMKRKGARPPLMTGIICMALGYLASMLAWTPWLFIAARALVGLGYGLSLLTAQAYTVRDGKLADMFAGVYAGSSSQCPGAMLTRTSGLRSRFRHLRRHPGLSGPGAPASAARTGKAGRRPGRSPGRQTDAAADPPPAGGPPLSGFHPAWLCCPRPCSAWVSSTTFCRNISSNRGQC